MAIRQPLSTGTSESSIIFYNGGHNHDGISSALIDTAKYSIYDFTTDFMGTDLRQSVQTENFRKFTNVVSDIVKTSVLGPSGITLGPNQVRAENISAGAVTATSLAANIVLVNNFIASGNYVTGVSGWAISSDGTAEFANTSIRGTIAADSLTTPGINISNTGAISSTNFNVTAGGNLTATNANITGAINATSGSISGNLVSGGTISGVALSIGANFGVDASGNLYAQNAEIYGEIYASSGEIGGFTLSSGTLVGTTASTIINPNGNMDIAGALNASGEVNSGSNMNASGNIEANGSLSAGTVVYADYLVGSGTVADSGVDVVRRSDGYYLKKTSIRSVKENIESFTNALDIVNALTPRTFNWKQNTGPLPDPDNIHTQQIKYAHKSHGFIVDEVQNVSEELVHWEIKADGVSLEPIMWKTDDLIAVSVQAIKDLVAQIGTLEARIATLERELGYNR